MYLSETKIIKSRVELRIAPGVRSRRGEFLPYRSGFKINRFIILK